MFGDVLCGKKAILDEKNVFLWMVKILSFSKEVNLYIMKKLELNS